MPKYRITIHKEIELNAVDEDEAMELVMQTIEDEPQQSFNSFIVENMTTKLIN